MQTRKTGEWTRCREADLEAQIHRKAWAVVCERVAAADRILLKDCDASAPPRGDMWSWSEMYWRFKHDKGLGKERICSECMAEVYEPCLVGLSG